MENDEMVALAKTSESALLLRVIGMYQYQCGDIREQFQTQTYIAIVHKECPQ